MSNSNSDEPRGIRNNNPGNIEERAGDRTRWQGERATDDDARFEEFETPEDGIRALAIVLLNYQRKHGLKTVREIIWRWAPPGENNSKVYASYVARRVGVEVDDPVDLTDYATMEKFVRAIVRHENGNGPLGIGEWYPDDVYHVGLRAAGVRRAQRRLVTTKTVVGSLTAGAGGVAALGEVVSESGQTVAAVSGSQGGFIAGIAAAFVILGAALAIYGRLQVRKTTGE